jgi:hypothetical protein
MGVSKSAAFFKTKEEADCAQKSIVEQANQNGHDVKVCVDETNDLADILSDE